MLQETTTEQSNSARSKPILERKRFLILILFLLCTSSNGFQWIQYSAVSEQTELYYRNSLKNDTANLAIKMTSTVFMISYIIFILPATYILVRFGLRVAFILGAFINSFGTLLKCVALTPNRFPLAMTGQTIASVAQIFTLGNPSYLAALWFSESYISTVASIGVFGNQVGIALGFLIPTELLGPLKSQDSIGDGMKKIMFPLLAIEILVLLLAIPFFKRRPKYPPSEAQAKIIENMIFKGSRTWTQSIKDLISDKNFMLLFISYGTVTGVFYALSINLDRFYQEYYVDEDTASGQVGLILTLAGLPGSVLAGYVLDKTRAYKKIALIICLATTVFMTLFAFLIRLSLIGSYFLAFALGFFMTGYLPVGFEVAAEMTYPISEGLSSALLNVSAQIMGIAITHIQLAILEHHKSLISNIFLCIVLVISCLATLVMKVKPKRSAANARHEATFEKSHSSLSVRMDGGDTGDLGEDS